MALATYVNPGDEVYKRRLHEGIAHSEHLRNVISGGKEPMCSNGPYWAHAILPIGIYMCKIRRQFGTELTAEEVEKLDLLMESLRFR